MSLATLFKFFHRPAPQPEPRITIFSFHIRCDCKHCGGRWQDVGASEFYHLAWRASAGMFDGTFAVKELSHE